MTLSWKFRSEVFPRLLCFGEKLCTKFKKGIANKGLVENIN